MAPTGSGARGAFDGLWNGAAEPAPLEGEGAPPGVRAHRSADPPVPEDLRRRDRSLRLAWAACREAWDQAGTAGLAPERVACTFSSSKGGLSALAGDALNPSAFADFLPHAVGTLLASRLGFRGPLISLSAACATGLASLAAGADLLERGDADAVLCGSAESSLIPLVAAGFRNMGLLSRGARGGAPFDRSRDGFLLGEGAGALFLEREDSARRRGAAPLAKLSGWALAADGGHPFEVEASGATVAALLSRVHRLAGLPKEAVGYVNAHGTGTRWNDAVEARALASFYGPGGPPVSSTKGATGHLLGAAGSVEAVFAVLAVAEGRLPDTRNLEDPDPELPVRHVARGGEERRVDHVLTLSYGIGGQLAAAVFSRV